MPRVCPLPSQNLPLFLQSQLAQPLHSGVSHFLTLLTSCGLGFRLLGENMPVAMAIMEALDPGTCHLPFLGHPGAAPTLRHPPPPN